MCRVGKTSLMNQYPFDLVVISLVIVLVYKKNLYCMLYCEMYPVLVLFFLT
jgi:hypothetical protein